MVLNERTEKGKRKKAPGIATFKRMSTYKWWWTEMEPSRWGSARRPWWPGSSPTPWSCCRWCRWRRWRRRTRQRTKTVWGPWDQYFKTFYPDSLSRIENHQCQSNFGHRPTYFPRYLIQFTKLNRNLFRDRDLEGKKLSLLQLWIAQGRYHKCHLL